MKKQILLSCALAWAVMAGAETIDITTFRYAGPYIVQAPFQVDTRFGAGHPFCSC